MYKLQPVSVLQFHIPLDPCNCVQANRIKLNIIEFVEQSNTFKRIYIIVY